MIPAVIGLSLLVRRDRWLGWASLAVLLLSIYVNAAVSDWWAGEAFGARRFVGNTVFFALGLTTLFSVVPWIERPSRLRWTAIALIVYNLLFVLQYQLFMRGFRELSPLSRNDETDSRRPTHRASATRALLAQQRGRYSTTTRSTMTPSSRSSGVPSTCPGFHVFAVMSRGGRVAGSRHVRRDLDRDVKRIGEKFRGQGSFAEQCFIDDNLDPCTRHPRWTPSVAQPGGRGAAVGRRPGYRDERSVT